MALFLILLLAATAGQGGVPMRYLHPAPESDGDVRYDYQWKILRTALERTRAGWGDYLLQPGPRMTERRQVEELQAGSRLITVMYLDTTPERELSLWPVRIPVDLGLVGYRVLLVRREDLERFAGAAVRSVDDLRRFTYGQGQDWTDVAILQYNGLKVVTGSDYEGLFDMAASGRFDALPRGAGEVVDEYERRRAALPGLAIEPGLLIHYPLPMYFWFPRTDEGLRLAARARAGMLEMLRDGTYQRIFRDHFQARIDRLGLERRRLLHLANPFLPPDTPLQDRRLWYRPGRRP